MSPSFQAIGYFFSHRLSERLSPHTVWYSILNVTRATLRSDLAILTMTGILDARPKVGYFYSGINGASLVGISNDDLDTFKKFIECSEEYSSLIEAQAFEIGFKLGVKFFEEI